MEKLYDIIISKMEKFCHSEPAKGYEATYLERAEKILNLYQKAGGIIDEYGESNIKLAEEQLEKILKEIEEII